MANSIFSRHPIGLLGATGLALALAAPFGAHAQTVNTPPADIGSLRQEIEAMRASYESQIGRASCRERVLWYV